MASDVLVVGAGGLGMSVVDALEAAGRHTVVGFVDDRGPELGPVLGLPILGRMSALEGLRTRHGLVVVALGDNQRRRAFADLASALGFELLTVVHPRAVVSRHAHLAAGALVMAGAVVGTCAQIGRCAIVNAGAVVDHHARVGDFAHLGVGACMAGGSELGFGAWLREGGALRAGQVLLAEDLAHRHAAG